MQLRNVKKLTQSLSIINDAIREYPQLLDTLAPVVGDIIRVLANEKCDMIQEDPSSAEKINKLFYQYVEQEYA